MALFGFEPDGISADLRFSWRSMRSAPGFTVTALLTLVLGMGATTALFSVVYAVLFRPLPYRNPEALIHIVAEEPGDSRSGVPFSLYEALRAQKGAIQESAIYYRNTGWSRVIVGGTDEPEAVQAGFCSAGLSELLGMRPILGRFFDEEEVRRAEPVTVISQMLWQRRFGGSMSILGKTVDIDNRSFTVIGVLPAEFQFPARQTQLWLPMTTNRYWPERPPPDDQHSRGFFMRWNMVARLRPAASAGQARDELTGLAGQLAERDRMWNMGLPTRVVPLNIEVSPKGRLALLVLFGAVVLVLVIACTNVANLMLARGAARTRELAIRLALGASQSRIVQQILVESLLLAFVAAGLALLLANWSIPFLVRWGPTDLPRLEETKLDLAVLAFTFGMSLLTAVLFGLGPALHASRNNPQNGLGGGRGATTSAKLSGLLIVAEFAFALVLSTSAGLLLRSLWEADRVDLGFQPARILAMRIRPPAGATQSHQEAFFDQLSERITAIPGVQNVGGIRSLFELGAAPSNRLRAVEGQPAEPDPGRPLTWTSVSGRYFQTMGIPLLAGRLFSDHDGRASNLVAVIDQSMAKRYWRNQSPIGKRFKGQDRRGQNDEWITVVGLVADARRQGIENESTPHVFLWHRQSEPTGEWVIRTAQPPETVLGSVRAAVREVDPRTVVADAMPLEKRLEMQTAERRFQTWLLALFAGLALTLASVGVFGVMSYVTAKRRHEIGIRMALGADRISVIKMVLLQGVGLAAVGMAVGIALAAGATRILSGLLYGVTGTDLIAFTSAVLLLLAVALVATLLPALRASRIDPLVALRRD